MKCNRCTYFWDSRVREPKACPRCKTRLDFIPKQLKRINTTRMEVR